ncbi:MAG TPA: DUF305 domain-containing protein [Candidatus Saccharimonadales bacterium]|nr:DUF305 domain-containing protein [Candidatus Saccharimonadales bacterium]
METKALVCGIVGFILGGLLVSVAATTFNKPQPQDMTMEAMVSSLKNKTGDEYDAAFINEMINHHQGAIDMAKMSVDRASHKEIKDLSNTIITAQEKEIAEMKQWQDMWGFKTTHNSMHGM